MNETASVQPIKLPSAYALLFAMHFAKIFSKSVEIFRKKRYLAYLFSRHFSLCFGEDVAHIARIPVIEAPHHIDGISGRSIVRNFI